jgi:sugar/nucleoside kinase (ribokinase family)
MSLLIVGSIALDTIETPSGRVVEVLGGAATYSSVAAAHFADVQVVGVVGEDFPPQYEKMLRDRKIDTLGLAKLEGKTFRWEGKYFTDLNKRETIRTELNVFEQFDPELPELYKNTKYIFLANIHPSLQLRVLEQVKAPKLVVCDTMNLWINTALKDLEKLVKKVDIIMLNDEEARMLTGEYSLAKAGANLLKRGLTAAVIKRGEHGATVFHRQGVFFAPAYPLEDVKDPTGAGDTFAGGFAGYLAKTGKKTFADIKLAAIYGSVLASFSVEEFSLKKLLTIKKPQIDKRFREFKKLVSF